VYFLSEGREEARAKKDPFLEEIFKASLKNRNHSPKFCPKLPKFLTASGFYTSQKGLSFLVENGLFSVSIEIMVFSPW